MNGLLPVIILGVRVAFAVALLFALVGLSVNVWAAVQIAMFVVLLWGSIHILAEGYASFLVLVSFFRNVSNKEDM